MKRKVMVTGKTESETRDIGEILTGRRQNKFQKWSTRKDYEAFLKGQGHIDLSEELLRLNSYPSTSRDVCISRCLALFDKAHSPKKQAPECACKCKNIRDIIES